MCAVLTLCLSQPSSLILIDATLEKNSKLVQAVTHDSQPFKIGNKVVLKTINIFLDKWDMAIAHSSFRLRNSLQKSNGKLGVKAGKI